MHDIVAAVRGTVACRREELGCTNQGVAVREGAKGALITRRVATPSRPEQLGVKYNFNRSVCEAAFTIAGTDCAA